MRPNWLNLRRWGCSGVKYDQDRYLSELVAMKWSRVMNREIWPLRPSQGTIQDPPRVNKGFATRGSNSREDAASCRLGPRAPGHATTAPYSRTPAVVCELWCERCEYRLSPTCWLTCTRVTRVQVCRARHSATVCRWALPARCSGIVCRPAGLRCDTRALAVPCCASQPVPTPPCELASSRRRTL